MKDVPVRKHGGSASGIVSSVITAIAARPKFATCVQTFHECAYGCKTALVAGAANGSANGGAGSGAAAYVVDTLLQVAPGAAPGAGASVFLNLGF